MASVDLRQLTKHFAGGVRAVDQLDLHVDDGELLVLVGPSGCGKTTTLRLIAGLEQPSSGHVLIGSRRVERLPPRMRDVGLAFQQPALFPHWTVYRNLSFGLTARRGSRWRRLVRRMWGAGRAEAELLSPGDIDERVRQTARMLGIDALLERRPTELSGGEQQRVALGRALVCRPSVLLLDEPLSHLDGPLAEQMRWELGQLHRGHPVTTIHVTHDQALALALADRVAVMNAGRILQVGTPAEVYDAPATITVAGFFGSPPMNLLEGVLSAGGPLGGRFNVCGWSVAVDSRALEGLKHWTGRALVAGIRPERVNLGRPPGSVSGTMAAELMVAAVEWIGPAELVRLVAAEPGCRASGSCGLVVRTHGGGCGIGQRVCVWFSAADVRWFDAASGERLSARAAIAD